MPRPLTPYGRGIAISSDRALTVQKGTDMSTPKAKFSWPMVILAGITLVLSSFGLFELAHVYAATPAPLALLAVGGFDLTALAAGSHALRVAKDGDSPGPWNALLVAAAGLSAVLQYVHTQLAGQPWAVGVMYAMFPVATVLLFEGTLRRAHRLNGRRTGRVAQPRATFELMQWLTYPKVTARAFRKGILDRSLSGDAAFKLALLELTPVDDDVVESAPLRTVELDYSRITGDRAAITSGLPGGAPVDSAEPAAPPPDTRPIATLVREKLQVRGADESGKAAVLADVLEANPAANPETVRREIRKQSGLRSA
jgi:hypothetical protein